MLFKHDGFLLNWNLYDIDKYTYIPIFEYFSEESIRFINQVLSKYTNLDSKKINLFIESEESFCFSILYKYINSKKFISSEEEIREDGSYISPHINDFNFKQRYDFLYLLLKCKYNHSQAISILNYYSRITQLNKDKLSKYLNAVGWKEIANKMEYDKDGKVESTFNFINDVIL